MLLEKPWLTHSSLLIYSIGTISQLLNNQMQPMSTLIDFYTNSVKKRGWASEEGGGGGRIGKQISISPKIKHSGRKKAVFRSVIQLRHPFVLHHPRWQDNPGLIIAPKKRERDVAGAASPKKRRRRRKRALRRRQSIPRVQRIAMLLLLLRLIRKLLNV